MHSFVISPEKLFERAYKIAEVYGFVPAHLAFKEYNEDDRVKIVAHKTSNEERISNLSTLLKKYFEYGCHTANEPIFTFHSNVSKETALSPPPKKQNGAYCTLTAIGVEGSYAEAMMLSCVAKIFQNMKREDFRIRINSMGTSVNSKEYFKKLSKTIRRSERYISPEYKKMIKENRYADLHRLLYNEHHIRVAENIVPTLRLLSDTARLHFEQVIEYLEAHDLSYELAPDLAEIPQYGTHTVFEVRDDGCPLYASGGRYDSLSRHLYRRKAPVVSATIRIPNKTTGKRTLRIKTKKPKVFFFHSGERARMSSLKVLTKLCDANIPVAHRLYLRRVSDQIGDCEHLYPFTMIFGQEEAENDVLCVRKSDTRASSVVRMDDSFPSLIKKFMRS